MSDDRPDPERLLAAAKASEAPKRGRLKVFLGAAAGVGKTCSMLDAAHDAQRAGRPVLVGVVEHHERAETLRRVAGLTLLPRRPTTPPEMDLDAALAARPALLLVDELAHTNAPGSRHPKRWQDVMELRDAGIDVWTTLNIQHIESMNDVVQRLTGVVVRETVPDRVIDEADEIELVDLPPDELLERLRGGKVYGADATNRALAGFFRKGNLLALRELALRRAAARVGEQVDDWRDAAATQAVWTASDRVLVAIGPSPHSARVVRVAARLARALDAPWRALLVRTPTVREDDEARSRALAHLRLAEQLGAQGEIVEAEALPETIVAYARRHNLNTVVLGATQRAGWSWPWRRSLSEEVARLGPELVLHGVPSEGPSPANLRPNPRAQAPLPPRDVASALGVVALATALGVVSQGLLSESDRVMLFLAAVGWAAFGLHRAAAAIAAVAAITALNFFFTEPYYTFWVADSHNLLTFVGVGLISAAVANLAGRMRARAAEAEGRAAEAQALYTFGRQLASVSGPDEALQALASRAADALSAAVCVWRLQDGELILIAAHGAPLVGQAEHATAWWAASHGAQAGAGTSTLPNAEGLYLPVQHNAERFGVLGVRAAGAALDDPDRQHLLQTMLDQCSLVLARQRLAEAAARSSRAAEIERVRSNLLASVSHDLRTPLAAITGSATTLAELGDRVPSARRAEMLGEIAAEALRLERLLENLLHLTRLDAGALTPRLEWEVAQDLVGVAVGRMRRTSQGRAILIHAPEEPIMLAADGRLLEQALVNLIENALRHTSGDSADGGAVEVAVEVNEAAGRARLTVSDRGPGVPEAERARIFETFARGSTPSGGAGLGLAIVRAVAQVHGGEARVEAREGGGARFVLDLPVGGPEGLHTPEVTP
ncbi:MAG: sensor histidine kinase KdpD [Deltaproteobacteria bacterium]|nr:sensor histidine kinase KdpD [Deltaproteobacteria bacterium]